MKNFIPTPYGQGELIQFYAEEQLISGTFEFALHHLFEKVIDLSSFTEYYKNHTTGRAAYHPSILLKVILYAYSKGVTSSREIAELCRVHLIFKALACMKTPHFTTIANFISRDPEAIQSVFEQVIMICDKAGLIGKELFAIDGCKMPSNASKSLSGTHDELAQKLEKHRRLIKYHIEKHQEADQSDDPQAESIKARHLKAKNTLEKNAKKIDEFLKSNEPRIGKGKSKNEVKSNITDNESAKIKGPHGTKQGFICMTTADEKHQVIVDAQAFGDAQEHHLLQPVTESIRDTFKRISISEDILKDGVIITADTGLSNEANNKYLYENNINAYIPDNRFRERDSRFDNQKKKYGKSKQDERKTKGEHFDASEFIFNAEEKTSICPAGEIAKTCWERVDDNENNKIFFEYPVSKCRQCELKKQCIRNINSVDRAGGKGRQVSFIVGHTNNKGQHTEWMKKRIDTEKGKAIYAHRMSTIEPVFANIEHNKGLRRLSLRGKNKVQGQWRLFCLVHNIEKLNNYGNLFRKAH